MPHGMHNNWGEPKRAYTKKIAVFIMQYSMRVRISQVGKDRHVDRMLTLIVAHQSRSRVPELDRREQPFER